MFLLQQYWNRCAVNKLIFSILLICFSFHVLAQQSIENEQVKNQIIVKYKDAVQSALQRTSGSAGLPPGLKVKRKIKFNRSITRTGLRQTTPGQIQQTSRDLEFDVIQVTDRNKSIDQAIKELQATGRFEYVEPDYIHYLNGLSNDPLLPQQWGLDSSHINDPDINALEAWDITTGDSDVVIAVVDTGIDYNHTDLVDDMWVNPGEIPGDGLDNDGNGVIDDIYGIDARNDDGDPIDERGHGTHVAGTIAAKGNNALGVSGVGWDLKLMSVQIFGASGGAFTSDIIQGLEYVHTMNTQYGVNVRITNNSWGGGAFSQALEDTIDQLNQQNIMFIAAAGNNNRNTDLRPYYPANYDFDNVIAVGSHTDTGLKSSFSNFGLVSVDVSAPGSDVLSTKMNGGTSCQTDPENDGYSLCSGTSMAAPHVSGIAGLLLSQYPSDDAFVLRQKIVHSRRHSGKMAKADQALNYDGFTASPTSIPKITVYKPITSDNPLPHVSEQFVLGTLKSTPISFSVRAEQPAWPTPIVPSWLSASPVSGFVSNTASVDINLDIDPNQLNYHTYSASVIASDLSAQEPDVSVPIVVDVILEPLDWFENLLDSESGDNGMGNSVAIDGDIAVVGAPEQRKQRGTNSILGHPRIQPGVAYVFRRLGANNWIKEAMLYPSDETGGLRFGSSVAISGNRIVVAAEDHRLINGQYSGAAYVFEYDGNQWLEKQMLIPSDGASNQRFGAKVDIDGEHIAISDKPIGSGSVGNHLYMYHLNNNNWEEKIKLMTRFQYSSSRFAEDFDLNGTELAVFSGKRNDNTSGVEFYVYENDNWSYSESITSAVRPRPEPYGDLPISNLGDRLQFDNDVLVARQNGAPALFVFHRQADNSWMQVDTIEVLDNIYESFANHIALKDGVLVVGAPSQSIQATNSGAIYIYQKDHESWNLTGKMYAQNPYSHSQLNFGVAVAVSGKYILAGSWTPDNQLISYGYLYEIPNQPHLETLTIEAVSSDWKSAYLDNTYDSMVPVCTVHYASNTIPVVTRIRNVGLSSFEIKLQNPGDIDAVVADDVYCIVAEEGKWTLPDGRLFEASQYTSTLTARSGAWGVNSDLRSYQNAYASPVILGQVMSYNDPNWSTFWSRGNTNNTPPNHVLRTGKHVGEDSITNRGDETIGYMVFEAGNSLLDTIDYEVANSADTVRHLGHANNDISINLPGLPAFAVSSGAGLDGGNGYWPVLEDVNALSVGQIRVAVDEDQIRDSERRHTTENVAYFTATSHINVPLTPVP